MGNYEFTRMPFGLKNAPALFQRVMNKVLSGLIGKCCFVYLDDIVVFSTSAREHSEHLNIIFQRLRDAKLKLKRKKCFFGLSTIELLGYTLSAEGISPQEKKVQPICDLPTPKNKTKVRSFLGMTGYYRQCIPGYACLSRPLQNLTSPKAAFVWTTHHENAFQELKKALTSETVMAYPDVS